MTRGATFPPDSTFHLIIGLERTFCAIPLSEVIEIMRPLPAEALAGTAFFVLGVARIRGNPVPVLDLSAIVNGHASTLHARFVTVRVQDRAIALAVKSVAGVVALRTTAAEHLPPLLHSANSDVIQTITALDSHFVMVLRAAQLLSEQDWETLSRERIAS